MPSVPYLFINANYNQIAMFAKSDQDAPVEENNNLFILSHLQL